MDGFNTNNRRSLFVDVSFSRGVLRACLIGPRIGDREATLVANAINAKVKEYKKKMKTLILDFSEVQFISSLGLGMCIDVRNNAEEVLAETSIVGMSDHLKELFEMMKLDKLFNFEQRQVDLGKSA